MKGTSSMPGLFQRASGWCEEAKQAFEYIPEQSLQTFPVSGYFAVTDFIPGLPQFAGKQ
jgi:hypothetical protein